jgi:glycosyltransferase involved in cell wall biosynthesis
MAIDISIIIPVLNERAHLETHLAALEAQTFDRARYEIIAVDNGSTDGSREFLAHHDGVSVINESRRDPYIARNTGVRVAQGKVIAFTDAHCVVGRDWLQHIWQALSQHHGQAFVGPVLHAADASYPLRLYSAYHQAKMAYIFERNITPSMFSHAGNLALHKTLFEELGGFRALPIPGDTALVQRLARRSPTVSICYNDKAVVRRQSLKTLLGMWRKTAEHAKYNTMLDTKDSAQESFSTLSWSQRREVLHVCRQSHHFTWTDSLLLSGVLIMGSLVYEIAQRRARPAKT